MEKRKKVVNPKAMRKMKLGQRVVLKAFIGRGLEDRFCEVIFSVYIVPTMQFLFSPRHVTPYNLCTAFVYIVARALKALESLECPLID